MDDDAGLEQLVVLFPNVPRKVVAQTYRQSGRDFDRALAAVLRVAPDWEPSPDAACAAAQKELLSAAETETELQALFPASTRDEVAAALRVSGGSSELAVDVLLASSEQGQLSQSVADIAHVFGLSTADVEVDFSAHGNSVDAVVDALLRRSQSGAVPVPPDDRAASIDFLRTMFPSEAPDVLDGLLDAHQSLDDVVDFLLSLDLLKVYDGELGGAAAGMDEVATEYDDDPPELQQMRELFPTASVDALVAALDSASWDVSEAVLLQTSRGDTHTPAAGKSRKWKKLGVSDVFTSVVVRPTPVWNGANASVTAGRDSVGETRAKRSPSPTRQPSPNVAPTAPSRVQQRHQQSTASAAPESAPTNSRYLFRQAADGEASAIHMSRMHAENRRKYAQLATRAHHMNDARAARMFREISQREERLQQLWANRITRQVTKIDLHGLFVSEALSIVAQVVGSMVQGDSVQFITGRGMHSSGNIPRIKLAVEEYVSSKPHLRMTVNTGFITVTRQ